MQEQLHHEQSVLVVREAVQRVLLTRTEGPSLRTIDFRKQLREYGKSCEESVYEMKAMELPTKSSISPRCY